MTASKPENDYFHKVVDCLNNVQEDRGICSFAYNFFSWEILSTDRAEILTLLEDYLNEDLDLVTVQLGENISDLSMLDDDFSFLIKCIQSHCPKAQIIVIGDFWEYNKRDEIKKNVALRCGVQYVDLSMIKDNDEFMAGLGTFVYGADGEWHKIEHTGVSIHPGDSGMEYIADEIIKLIE